MPDREEVRRRDAEDLRRLGYGQQLLREMGGFSNFAVSFSIISILTGAVLLFGYGLKLAGPIVNTAGWPLVSVFTLAIAAAMAQLASAYPTAGGLYFWAYRLGGRTWAWWTAWANMIGQVTITAGINVAAAIYAIGAAVRIFGLPESAELPVLGPLTSWRCELVVMVLLMVPQVLLNVYGIRAVARLNDFSVWWHIAGGGVIVALLLFFGKHHNGLAFLFRSGGPVTPLEASSAKLADGSVRPALVIGDSRIASPLFALFPGLAALYRRAPFVLAFGLALLQAQWTYTGYDASAHMAEETLMARKSAAWGVFLSVAVSAVFGYVLLVVLTLAIPDGDVARTASDPYPVLFIAGQNLSALATDVIAVFIGGAMWLCGCSSISSMARMWYAFARDGGIPGSRWLASVDRRSRAPAVAIVVTSLLAVLISIYAAAFTVITSISTIALYLAYGIPIFLDLRNQARRRGEATGKHNAPWNLGRVAQPIRIAALLWIAVISVLFTLPPNELVLWTLLLLGLVLAAYWFAGPRRHFRGPGLRAAGTV